jgi:Tol biopolymer transport system component
MWHPDGKHFSFTLRTGNYDVYLGSVDGSPATPLIASPVADFGESWSRKGEYLLFTRVGRQLDIWLRRSKPDGGVEERPFVNTEFDELSSALSPDGRYVAFESDKSGQHEVYVRPFPAGDDEWQVSTDGGHQPSWRGDGREMFYVKGEDTLMAVGVDVPRKIPVGVPRALFQQERLRGKGKQYDITQDGRRFILVKVLRESKPIIRVVQNWTSSTRH